MANVKNPSKVVTGKVRFSFVHVFEPVAVGDDENNKKYSVSILIPKSDTATLAKIKAAIQAAAEAGVNTLGGKIPKGMKTPLRDGDEERDDEVYAGCMFMTANTVERPGVVDADLQPILDRNEFYSGCYGRASVTFYAFNKAGNKGIACSLNNLQKLEDGDRLGGSRASAEEDFGDDDDLS